MRRTRLRICMLLAAMVATMACDRLHSDKKPASPPAPSPAATPAPQPELPAVDDADSTPAVREHQVCSQVPVEGRATEVCTLVSVSGATAEGLTYPTALCPEVRALGRPFHSVPVPHRTKADDPRLNDGEFQRELHWVTAQVRSTACTCCHASVLSEHAAMWDIDTDAIWTDQLTPRGLAIMSGRLDSSLFGDSTAEENHGFTRRLTGVPSTDGERMRAFFDRELARQGVSAEQIHSMRPLAIPKKSPTTP